MRKHRLAHRARPHLQIRPERAAHAASHAAADAHPAEATGRAAGCPRVGQQVLPQASLVDVVLAAHRTRMVRDPALHWSVRNALFQFLKTFSAVLCDIFFVYDGKVHNSSSSGSRRVQGGRRSGKKQRQKKNGI